jgi:hypothetical protein
MSIDKQEGGGEDLPPSAFRRHLRQAIWYVVLGPLFLLPFLMLGSVVWGVCLRILVELFNWSYNLFGF